VIALKKVIGRMVQTHYPDNGDKHITEFKKRKSAQKICKLAMRLKAI
jgi:hypothetical protein